MSENCKKYTVETLKELCLYPHCTTTENVIRGVAWIVSWTIGILINLSAESKALCGAYFVFAISLLCEFLPRNKTRLLVRVIHGVFCSLLIIIIIVSLVSAFKIDAIGFTRGMSFLLLLGWIVTGMITIGTILALIGIHGPHDEDKEIALHIEEIREQERKRFIDKLNGK